MSERENKTPRVKTITRIYYSNPKVQEAIFNFAKDREVVPSYMMESFGKRPDTLQYPTDIIGLVNKGATSFHCSEELWQDTLKIDADMSSDELSEIRKSWDLLIDIDSPFLDYSKIATKLIIEELEKHGIKNYGIKFSGSKGFHIIVPSESFPRNFQGIETKKMFPEWPRAILEYLINTIKPKYNKIVSTLDINFKALQERTKLSKKDITEITCPNCGKSSKKGKIITYKCLECKNTLEKPNNKITKRKLKCINEFCPGYFEIIDKQEYFYCEHCKTSSIDKKHKSDKKVIYTKEASQQSYSNEFEEQISGSKMASLDLVLVSPRHLFRMPYSLHEKTALASIVITKDQLEAFDPRDANPMRVKIKNFYPTPENGEAQYLLSSALSWKKIHQAEEGEEIKKKYVKYDKIDLAPNSITEDMFPKPIKKLLKGLKDGRKRGLFILLTFLRSLNFSPDYLNREIREWNKKNDPPLKEGYVKGQIDWHLRQKRQILPPNYNHVNFYKDIGLVDSSSMPKEKNPVSEVMRIIRRVRKRNIN